MNPVSALISTVQLVLLFRSERYDVVHVHTPVAALVGRLAAWIARVPLVIYTAHGFYFHEGMPAWKRRIFIWLEKIAGYWTDLLFTQSSEDAETAIFEKIMPQNQILAIGNGVSVARFDFHKIVNRREIRMSLGIPDEAFVVGLVGRQIREKGIAEFLKAARRSASLNPNIQFLVVGDRLDSDRTGGVMAELLAARDELGERLIVLGLRNDIPDMLCAMDVFCLPSWREGMPRTIIEAMMMARPVIATNIRGSREEVVHEVTGLLVPVRSPEALAMAIQRLAKDPAWSVELGLAGRERALALIMRNASLRFR
jgi:glycosyltransferase involved in cell wall biosynthesis